MIMAHRQISEVKLQWTNKNGSIAIIFAAPLGTVVSPWDRFVQHLAQYSLELYWARCCSLRFVGISFRQTAVAKQTLVAWVQPCCQAESFMRPATPHPFWSRRKSVDYTLYLRGQRFGVVLNWGPHLKQTEISTCTYSLPHTNHIHHLCDKTPSKQAVHHSQIIYPSKERANSMIDTSHSATRSL